MSSAGFHPTDPVLQALRLLEAQLESGNSQSALAFASFKLQQLEAQVAAPHSRQSALHNQALRTAGIDPEKANQAIEAWRIIASDLREGNLVAALRKAREAIEMYTSEE